MVDLIRMYPRTAFRIHVVEWGVDRSRRQDRGRCGCQDAITSDTRIHVGKRLRHAFGSLRANSYSHRFRFDSPHTTSPCCLRACVLQAQAAPAARPEVVLAPREPPARVASLLSRRYIPLALHFGSSHPSVCCWLCLYVPVCTTPSSSCASLFVSLSLRRSRLGSRAVCNRQRLDDRNDRVDRVVVSLRSQSPAWQSPRHPAQRRPRSFSCLSARHLIMAL